MNDDELSRLLKTMPRRDASPEFTDRVLGRLQEGAPKPSWRRPTAGLALAAAVLLGIWIGEAVRQERREQVRSARSSEELEQMQTEYRELQRELEQLRRLTSDVEPVLDLGGSADMDFIFDLRALAERDSAARPEPVSHSSR